MQKGLVRKAEKQPVGRAEHLEVTGRGFELLTRDPIQLVIDSIDRLSPQEREALASATSQVIRAAGGFWPTDARHGRSVNRPSARVRQTADI